MNTSLIKSRNQFGLWLQVLFGLGLGVGLCFALIHYSGLISTDWQKLYTNLSPLWCTVFALLTVILLWSGAHKWFLWSKALHGTSNDTAFYLRHFVLQNWLGQFVPSPVAIILGRSWASRHIQGIGWRAGGLSAIYDNVLELFLMALLLPLSWLIISDNTNVTAWVAVLFSYAAIISAVLFVAHKFLPSPMRPYTGSIMGWSVLRTFLNLFRNMACVGAFGLTLNMVHVMAGTPIVTLLSVIPLTPGNLGIADWGWVGVLGYAGANTTNVLLFTFGFRLLMLVVLSLLLAVVSFLQKTGQHRII